MTTPSSTSLWDIFGPVWTTSGTVIDPIQTTNSIADDVTTDFPLLFFTSHDADDDADTLGTTNSQLSSLLNTESSNQSDLNNFMKNHESTSQASPEIVKDYEEINTTQSNIPNQGFLGLFGILCITIFLF